MKQFNYTQHDLDTAERITAVEIKLDNIDKNLSNRFDGISDTLKEIKAKQNQAFKIKDAFTFFKKNYMWLIPVIAFVIGGDDIEAKVWDWFVGSHTEAQDEVKE